MENNIFDLMPTNRSEEITSAALVYIINSKETDLRDKILKTLFGKNVCLEEVKARTEVCTYSDIGNGRLDIIVDTKGFVYGIENKLGSDFGDLQLEKYQNHLSNNYHPKKNKLVALLPEGHKDFQSSEDNEKRYKWDFCKWEDLLNFHDADSTKNNATVVYKELRTFVSSIISPFSTEGIKNAFIFKDAFDWHHHEFLRNFIKTYLLSNIGGRLGSSRSKEWKYCGSYFGQKVLEEDKIDGYCSLESLPANNGGLELVILTKALFDGLHRQNTKFEKMDSKDRDRRPWIEWEKDVLGPDFIMWKLSHNNAPKNIKGWEELGEEVKFYFSEARK